MRPLLLAALVSLLAPAAGCAHYDERNTLPLLRVDLGAGTNEERFEQLVTRTRALGYTIEFSDAAFGVFGTRTRAQLDRREGPATMVVQCYADGHATVSVAGGTLLPDGSARVPARLRREAVAFAQALESEEAP